HDSTNGLLGCASCYQVTRYQGADGLSSSNYSRTVTYHGSVRIYKMLRSGYDGSEVGSTNTYNAKGQLIRTREDGLYDRLYEYDALGRQYRSGFDVNGNGTLDLSSSDRITETDEGYVKEDGVWYRYSSQGVYASSNDQSLTVLSQSKQMVSGGTSTTNRSIDIHGNETKVITTMNRATKTVTRRTVFPDSSSDEISVTVNGLLQSTTYRDGRVVTYVYDALGRVTNAHDTASGTTVTAYDAKGRRSSLITALSNVLTYTYYPESGRLKTITGGGGDERFEYDVQGRMIRQWGSGTLPRSFAYDEFGRPILMATYQGGTNWNSTVWPAESGPSNTTRWVYDPASGRLKKKIDDANQAVVYVYTDEGRLSQRTWVRGVETDYEYNRFGDLVRDTTPGRTVTRSYGRNGRLKQVAGPGNLVTRFRFNDTLQVVREEREGVGAASVLRFAYEGDAGDVPGRLQRIYSNHGYDARYEYDTVGRMATVRHGVFHAVSYTYATNSSRILALNYRNRIGEVLTVTNRYNAAG
ncbi:MAG: hypothetical protein AAF492_20035, partial [Verrucomicrobiota bacterium]